MSPAEHTLNKAQKFVRLVARMQDQNGIMADDAMGDFGLDDRTLRRYLSDLRDIGVPVQDDGRGTARRLSLDPSYGRRGVRLHFLEVVSLHFGRTLFNFLEGTDFADVMDDALERINSWSGDDPRHIGFTDTLDQKFMAVPEHAKDHARDADTLNEILTALLDSTVCDAHYARPASPSRSYRLHPYTLAHWRQGLYLFALDVKENKIKTFAVDRFRNFKRCRGEKFEYPADYDPKDMVVNCFGIIGGEVQTVQLQFSRSSAPYVQERVWHHSQTVENLAGGQIQITMRVGISPELQSWILSFGPEVRVILPSELSERIRQKHEDAAKL